MNTPALIFLVGLALASTSFAVDPPPDGGYPNANTAEGDNALFSLTTGGNNTAVGFDALYRTTSGDFNTAMGTSALYSNQSGMLNVAIGSSSLFNNTDGFYNVAIGYDALRQNKSGNNNVAVGPYALHYNKGSQNTAVGSYAVSSDLGNSTASSNTGIGYATQLFITTGSSNVTVGDYALEYNAIGNSNTAVGHFALKNTKGESNIGLGSEAGIDLTDGDNNIAIGNPGVAGESGTIRIGTPDVHTSAYLAGVAMTPLTTGGAVAVGITPDGKLGVRASSGRYKEAIKPMAESSEAILSLKPVTFRYKKELDPNAIPQFGLVAEDVAKVDPDLVARDNQGKPFTVRYEEVNAMLLNEFLKEHKKVEEQAKKAETQATKTEQLESQLQQMAARLDAKGL